MLTRLSIVSRVRACTSLTSGVKALTTYRVRLPAMAREDDDTPMTMFFGFMGLLIFVAVGPLLLVLW